MVATIGQMATAEYYLESQRSFRHPNEYYTAGEEPDGAWFNPKGLFGLEDGAKVDPAEFQRLYNGHSPDGSDKLVQRAGNPDRSPGVDMTFSVDKSVSSLWAIAEPEKRRNIEAMATAAARAALEDSVLRYCSYTRVSANGVTRPVEADLMGATFVHGTSRENDPQLHVHCTIFNLARTKEDGKWRAHHQYPVYSWKKAAGALFRACMAWELQQELGVKMERYGPNAEFTRVSGMPEDLQAFWSKRRKAIVARAGELGIPSLGNASRLAGVNKLTRAGKSHDNDPEVRHRRWREEAEGFAERETLIESVTGHRVKIGREQLRELTDRLDDLPAHLAREEAIFRRPDMVEAAANAAAGLMGRDAVGTAIERLRRNPEIERLEPKKPTAESMAGMAHTEVYSTRHNLGLEQAVRDMAEAMAADTGHALPEEAVKEKVETLLAQQYPLSQEQSLAIRHATVKGGRVSVIEGAAGSGKTTTLRPITDLHREHGYGIVPTAVAWRTAVALGDDCDARPYCVDKLLKLAARGQVEIGRNTLIVVDEAGMLSTRQAHHILQLSERHGAKVVFAGDTRQQQPVEAGPGLRLIRDVAGSVRVDRIRRQKADLEDVLVHVHGETPELARFRAGLTSPKERDSILAAYEAMERKPVFTPWQVAVSEALRDGEAAQAIDAWHLRNRLHLCHNEEKTLAKLVDDWARHVKAEPDSSTVVLARTKAEARALSWLMREEVLARTPEAKRAVVEVSRDLDGRVTQPIEIAVGDRLRIGATQWQKQLFNGTVVTVEDIEVRGGQDAAVTRKARNRRAGEAAGRGPKTDTGNPEPSRDEFSVHITARTDDGRRVSFRHDEIRDFHDNIRLDYGYAMTIASAQGLTVDRAFLLVDDRPARETIYPAATRHREGIDVYVNRKPIVFDIADRRPEDEAERPVPDSEVRAYLAERWSRSQPKEAALDYVSDGMWRDPREEEGRRGPAPLRRPGEGMHGAAEGTDTAEARLSAANDNAIVRIAREVRHTVAGWRHGAEVDAFAAGRAEVMASWDALRERARDEGEAVALSPGFRETLDRHAVLLRQAASFTARTRTFEPLLAARGIGCGELDRFEALHERAQRHRRAAVMRRVHRTRQQGQQRDVRPEEGRHATPADARSADALSLGPGAGQGELALQGGRARSRGATPSEQAQTSVPTAEPPAPDWQALYHALEQDWNDLVARSREPDLPLPLMDGYGTLIGRVRALAACPGIPERARGALDELLQYDRDQTGAREAAHSWLAEAERHIEDRKSPNLRADRLGIPVSDLHEYPAWRDAAQTLAETGEALLADEDNRAYLDATDSGRQRARHVLEQLRARIVETRAEAAGRVEALLAAAARHLDVRATLRHAAVERGIGITQLSSYGDWRGQADRILEEGKELLSDETACRAWLHDQPAGGKRLERAFTGLGRAIRDDDEALARARRDARERNRLAHHLNRLRLATDAGVEAHAGIGDHAPARVLWRLRRVYDFDGRAAERNARTLSQERWVTLRDTWNRQVDRAEQEGVHAIYTRGYETLRDELTSIARDDPHLDDGARDHIRTVLHRLDLAQQGRAQIENHLDRLADRLAYRDDVWGLNASAAWDTRPIPDRERYEGWRDSAEDAIAAAEAVLADRSRHGIHLDGLAYRGKSLAPLLADVRSVLTDDDRHVAATLAGTRKGEDQRIREDRISRLLGDPGTLREMRKRHAERKQVRSQEKRQRGLYRSRGITM